MKVVLFVLSILMLSLTSFSLVDNNMESRLNQNSEPECVITLNRNISKAEVGVDNLKTLKNSDTPSSVFNRDLMRFGSTISGLEGSIAACKTDNPNHDFTVIDKKVSKIKADFKLLQDANNADSEAKKHKKTYIEVNKYSIYIFSFPTSHPPKLDMTANWIFTREEVVFFLSSKSDDTKLKNSLNKFIYILKSESTKKAFLSTISDMKGQVDKAVSLEELKNLILDVEHLKTVFAPGNSDLTQVVNAAKAMQKQLSK